MSLRSMRHNNSLSGGVYKRKKKQLKNTWRSRNKYAMNNYLFSINVLDTYVSSIKTCFLETF